MSYDIQKETGKELNKLYESDLSIHNWYRFVLSFPPHLVRNYINEFNLSSESYVLDPFCGTGTTLVESKKLGIKSIGFEANPVVYMCASAKVDWNIVEYEMLIEAESISTIAQSKIDSSIEQIKLAENKENLIIKNSISPIPLHKTLILEKVISSFNSKYEKFYKTALAREIVFSYSNLKFGPEVGVKKKKIDDVDVVSLWLNRIKSIITDINENSKNKYILSKVILGDSRNDLYQIPDSSIDAVITSPPYPNEKDYSRTTRLESVLLNFINDKEDLRKIKKSLLRSNTRGIYKDDDDIKWVENNTTVNELADSIERKRLELGKTSGFEKLYHRVVKLYFGGMAKHLNDLKPKLKNGAKLAYVVGDQFSYFRIPIRTGTILAEIAQELGYKVIRIDLFRTRLATATKENINEEVVVLEYVK
ncbi:DNA methyltransferase [Haemophilus paracuniculus]|uniref:site-specific DNA-methyltransferase (cytosine-N(4)-specific) n=1 Tax=Haemophilus paracuniculus TaxID=734 RepID=A0A1T0ATF8_9PAST|nr:DNA methyltransferase [Haemophilus paracuniculus]OOR99300.1 DNA methyltransferase [Haemophilus paracuniculus]